MILSTNIAHVQTFTPAKGLAYARFIFAHGAGAGMDSEFMTDMAQRLSERNIEVLRFNFPYMQIMSETGKRRPPQRMPALLAYYHQVVQAQATELPLFIGGKSMGGRASTLLMTQKVAAPVKGVMVLGYPFHPQDKPDRLRIDHFDQISCPTLIIQGERDTMGSREQIAGYALPEPSQAPLQIEFLADGDHSLKPRKASGVSYDDNLARATDVLVAFIDEQL